jgi:hypothetical protein
MKPAYFMREMEDADRLHAFLPPNPVDLIEQFCCRGIVFHKNHDINQPGWLQFIVCWGRNKIVSEF